MLKNITKPPNRWHVAANVECESASAARVRSQQGKWLSTRRASVAEPHTAAWPAGSKAINARGRTCATERSGHKPLSLKLIMPPGEAALLLFSAVESAAAFAAAATSAMTNPSPPVQHNTPRAARHRQHGAAGERDYPSTTPVRRPCTTAARTVVPVGLIKALARHESNGTSILRRHTNHILT